MSENKQEIIKTLTDIFEYLGVSTEYANDATVIRYIEWLINKTN